MTLPEDKPRRVFNKASLSSAIKDGKQYVLFGSKVYDLTKFSKFHPGGQLAIQHNVGQDTTEVVTAFHPTDVVDKRLPRYYVGDYVEVKDISLLNSNNTTATTAFEGTNPASVVLSPILAAIENDDVIKRDYLELNKKLHELGMYRSSFLFYAWRWTLFAGVVTTAIYLLRNYAGNVGLTVLSAFMFAFTWHGLAFTAHDAGHNSVTTNRSFDYLIAIFLADFVGGLSIGWWKFNHNTHHIVTNDPEHDPDIQHLPFFAVGSRFFSGLYSTFYKRVMKFDAFAKVFVSLQHFLYYPVLTFGRFNLYAHSIQYLFRTDKDDRPQFRVLELIAMSGFWFWYGYLIVYCTIPTLPLRLLFVYISHAATAILHLQITLSHFAMSVEQRENESFVEKAVRTTMDVECPEWFDWFHGGLQFQIEHHMFPRVPRCNFRRLQPMVKDFCEKHNLEYYSYGFIDGNMVVLGALKKVADQVKLLVNSADPAIRYKQN